METLSSVSDLNLKDKSAATLISLSEIQPPAWNNSAEYSSFESPEFSSDFLLLKEKILQLNTLASEFAKAKTVSQGTSHIIGTLLTFFQAQEECETLWFQLKTFSRCELTVNGKDFTAKKMVANLEDLKKKIDEAFVEVKLYLIQASQGFIDLFLSEAQAEKLKYTIELLRTLKDSTLSETEEKLIANLSQSGFSAWSQLYTQLCGKLQCEIKNDDRIELYGLGQTYSYLSHPDESIRKSAWNGLQKCWEQQEESAAAILNGLAKWRLSESEIRSINRPVHFLESSLHQNHTSHETLEAMMTALTELRPLAQQAILRFSKLIGKDSLDPWDIMAPLNSGSINSDGLKNEGRLSTFSEALDLVEKSFTAISPEMGEFVRLMQKNNWIEARVLPHKSQGAYMTSFLKSKTPRIFQSFIGTPRDISTLAHELGHAYHYWVMKDLSVYDLKIPMTLAETASVFSETVLNEFLQVSAKSKEEKIQISWGRAYSAISFLINIPMRFDFEKEFYQRRKDGVLTAQDLCELMSITWKKWYGSSCPNPDPYFWAHKSHFSMTSSFYNYPYTYGYLFGLSVYEQRQLLGDRFFPKYKEFLKDTGKLSAEDLIQKYLDQDIRKPEFWKSPLSVAKGHLENFIALTSS